MPAFDIFNSDAFSLFSLTDAVEKIPYEPSLLGDMGLFSPAPVRTPMIGVERRDGVLTLIQTSERGAPSTKAGAIRPKLRNFNTSRLIKEDAIHSHELLNMRAFGSESEIQTVQNELMFRMGRLSSDLNVTLENHRLGAVQGIVLDADGSTIYNFFTEFGISQPSEITFSNAAVTAAGGMRAFLANNIVRPTLRALGATTPVQIMALCGDTFFDWFINHADVVSTYNNWQAAAELRQGKAFGEFEFGGVQFVNYRGTDDNSTIGISVAKVKFFPVGVRSLFQQAMAPGESMDLVGTMGRERYAQVLQDPSGRNAFVTLEVATYPLMFCTRPEVLLRGAYS